MSHDVEQELLRLDQEDADPGARLPPPVGIEGRVPRASNRDSRLVSLQGPAKRPA
jgi:hypothetical protein